MQGLPDFRIHLGYFGDALGCIEDAQGTHFEMHWGRIEDVLPEMPAEPLNWKKSLFPPKFRTAGSKI